MVKGEAVFISNWEDSDVFIQEIKDDSMTIISPGVYLHPQRNCIIIVEDELPEELLYYDNPR